VTSLPGRLQAVRPTAQHEAVRVNERYLDGASQSVTANVLLFGPPDGNHCFARFKFTRQAPFQAATVVSPDVARILSAARRQSFWVRDLQHSVGHLAAVAADDREVKKVTPDALVWRAREFIFIS